MKEISFKIKSIERKCEECKQPLKGRKDQKFCSDYCRNTFNNRQNEQNNTYIRKVNGILKRNRRILSTFFNKNETQKEIYELAELGFNFRYFTHSYKDSKGVPFYFCYDLGYSKENGLMCQIIENSM